MMTSLSWKRKATNVQNKSASLFNNEDEEEEENVENVGDTDVVIKKKKIQTKEGVIVSITLGRRLLGTFLTIFFPTILLNVIGYSTNYFKAFFFEVQLVILLQLTY